MIPIHRLKGLVNTFLKSRGYRCEKYIPRTSNHLTLFRLGSAMLEQAYTSLSFVQIGGYDGVSCDDPVFAGAARRGWTGAVLARVIREIRGRRVLRACGGHKG